MEILQFFSLESTHLKMVNEDIAEFGKAIYRKDYHMDELCIIFTCWMI